MLSVVAACGNGHVEAEPRARAPLGKLEPVAAGELCATKGTAPLGGRVDAGAMRAVAPRTSGEAASLEFTFRGDPETTKALAGGQLRRQLGLKLRAGDGCNLVYVMYRLDPKPMLDVSVKRNPGARTHAQCGAGGYTKVKPSKIARVPMLAVGDKHTLRAELHADALTVWLDEAIAWRGTLPASARDLAGPSGLRSDNVAFDLHAFHAPASPTPAAPPKCGDDDSD